MKGYLSGPMAGIPEFNFPAFHAFARQLRARGHEVVNPAEIDDGETGYPWEHYIGRDVAMLLASQNIECVWLMDGWRRSRGARLEVHIALERGWEIRDAATDEPLLVCLRFHEGPDKCATCATT